MYLLELPIVVVHADDIIVLREEEEPMQCFLNQTGVVLTCTELNINYNKSALLISDMLSAQGTTIEDYHIEGRLLKCSK